jgi:DNA-binding NarL/FixJ family response regulator
VSGIKVQVKDNCLVITLPFRVEMEVAEEAALKLTRQERQALNGLLKGQSNKEIAAEMNLSERTVKYHVSQILRKMNLRSRVDVVRHFHKRGNLTTPEQKEE